MDTVTGQPWSAPAYPVKCDRERNLISCTPTDPHDVRETNCYLNVFVSGTATTICSTYDGHAAAIKAAGGSPVTVDFGCHIGDLVCVTFENWGRSAALLATALMFSILDATRFQVGGSLWNAAAAEWSFWAWATLIVLLGSMIWAITAAVVSRERDQLVGALVRSFIAIPAVPLTFWLIGHLVQSIDDLMSDIIGRRTGIFGLFSTMQSVMWAGGHAGYVFGFILYGIILIGMVLLLAVFLFRNVALAALIMVGPIAWMVFPSRSVGPQWVVRYISAVVVLLLTGPLTLSFFSLVVRGLATVKTIWDPASWPYLVGLALIAFAPFAVFGLFSFLGAVAADSLGSRLGGHAAAMGTRTARTAASIPTRLGSLPAGVPAARRAPTSRAATGGRGPTGPGGSAGSSGKHGPSGNAASGSGRTNDSASKKPTAQASAQKPAPHSPTQSSAATSRRSAPAPAAPRPQPPLRTVPKPEGGSR
ncbi:hypothetical protein LK09_08165 [Microbacterium mangrovi]|uniref:TrbL/VirB6 plasmid conjugal transfer protein n=1 Tax=Microbacterium mangrovi TaxID=1348253 RepID=A0A0B2AAR1_9MICO|nr:hypothetical protein [Microbacterium mangrovi]KHK98838.1 hypothetical protein LK09_08165 [Microbacterium mangrovi]